MKYILICLLLFSSCKAQEDPKSFSSVALDDIFTTLDGEDIQFKSILEKHAGKTILIDVWASWCKDCIKGLPKVKVLQSLHEDVAYVFLSLDKGTDRWKKGIDTYEVVGDHYFMKSGWKGAFGEFLDLDWIPRYVVINPQGEIEVFKAIKANDKKLIQALE